MTDLTKIEKPYVFCTREEQEGLKALVGIEGALQKLSGSGSWTLRLHPLSLGPHLTYRQNPDWQPPKLDVPDWFWEKTDFNYVAMDENREVYAYELEPFVSTYNQAMWDQSANGAMYQIDEFFTGHNFNPHNTPWHQSLTVRPGLEE